MKSIQIALLVALLLPVAAEVSADSRPSKSSSSSYKSGFSSQRSAPTSTNRSSGNSSFGSFGSRPSTPPPRAPAPAPSQAGRNGGFGSFGNAAPRQDSGAAPVPRKSDSALSQSMNKSNAEANALRSLEARRAAQEAANAPREIRPVPSGPLPSNGQYGSQQNGQYGSQQGGQYNNRQNGQYGGAPAGQYGGGMPIPMPQPQQMQQNSGLMNVITGFLLARATTNTHARGNNNSNGYPGSTAATVNREENGSMAAAAGANAIPVQSQPKSSFGMAVLRTMAWLAILAALGWLVYFGWKFLRRGKAPSTANYSFERN